MYNLNVIAGSGFLNVRICCFSLTLMIDNEETMDFWQLVDFDILVLTMKKKKKRQMSVKIKMNK